MTVKFKFDRDFQLEVLGLVSQNYDFLTFSAELIKPEYFDDIVLGWFFKTITEHQQDYDTKPTPAILSNEINKAVRGKRIREGDVEEYQKVLKRIQSPIGSGEYVKEEVVRFCKRQALKKAYLETAAMSQSEDDDVWDTIAQKVGDACQVGNSLSDIGVRYFVDYAERLRAKAAMEDGIIMPTGITELDNYMGGGLKAGQLGLWMAGTNVGKSIALVHTGKRCVVGGGGVVHYTLELPERDIADRYDSSWTHVNMQDLDDQHLRVQTKLHDLGLRYGNKLIIKQYPTYGATIGTIKNHLRRVIQNEFMPSLIVLDYLDLVKPTTKYNDYYADLGTITAETRGLAGEFDLPLWSATQVNRAGHGQEIADLEHVSDSFMKMFIADIVAIIMMNREERNANKARIFLGKNRNGPAKVEVGINTDYARMCFYAPCAAPPPPAPIVGDVVEPVQRRAAKGEIVVEEAPPKRRREPKRKLKTTDFPLGKKIDEK